MNRRRSLVILGLAMCSLFPLACGSGGSGSPSQSPGDLSGGWTGDLFLEELPAPFDRLELRVRMELDEDDLGVLDGRVTVSGFGAPTEAPVTGSRMELDVLLQSDVSEVPRFETLALDAVWDGEDELSGVLMGTALVLDAPFEVREALTLERQR